MDTIEYQMHKGARTALYVAAALIALFCITVPIAAYLIWRISKARVVLSPSSVVAYGMTTDEIVFSEVERIGVLRVPVVARGVGGVLARMKLGNMDVGLNLVAKLTNGKTVKFIVNQYERHEDLLSRVGQSVQKPMEQMQMGLFTWKWPER